MCRLNVEQMVHKCQFSFTYLCALILVWFKFRKVFGCGDKADTATFFRDSILVRVACVCCMERKVLRIVWKLIRKLFKNFHWCRWGAECRVKRAQTRERGPPTAPAEIYANLLELHLNNSNIFIFIFIFEVNIWCRLCISDLINNCQINFK